MIDLAFAEGPSAVKFHLRKAEVQLVVFATDLASLPEAHTLCESEHGRLQDQMTSDGERRQSQLMLPLCYHVFLLTRRGSGFVRMEPERDDRPQ